MLPPHLEQSGDNQAAMPSSPRPQTPNAAPLRWDVFCQVIDNWGDLGVCWRLCCNLAARGQQVRLWVDDASALQWMAPQGCPGLEVRAWAPGADFSQPGDVLVETFGTQVAPEFIAYYAMNTPASSQKSLKDRVWINLEYLSAEPFVERSHGLPSPVMSGPAKGRTKWFFYPGFTERTGGLLREDDLLERQTAFDASAWLAAQGIARQPGEQLISLFCYEPPALGAWLQQLAQGPTRARLLVTHGRAAQAIADSVPSQIGTQPANSLRKPLLISEHLQIDFLPPLTQTDYDHLLWACDINMVRGEDSLVRALWAGKPFVWQIYPQDDGAHRPKLEAFLGWLQAPPSQREFHAVWNGLSRHPLPRWDLPTWAAAAHAARAQLLAQRDLVTQLLDFVQKKQET
jgi:uncharacterized repeat protein (TIGR03837 family)